MERIHTMVLPMSDALDMKSGRRLNGRCFMFGRLNNGGL